MSKASELILNHIVERSLSRSGSLPSSFRNTIMSVMADDIHGMSPDDKGTLECELEFMGQPINDPRPNSDNKILFREGFLRVGRNKEYVQWIADQGFPEVSKGKMIKVEITDIRVNTGTRKEEIPYLIILKKI